MRSPEQVIVGAIQEGMKLPGSDRDLRVIAKHVEAALTSEGLGIYPHAAVGEMQRILWDAEEWANHRIKDWGDKNCQDVLDIINREGEWRE